MSQLVMSQADEEEYNNTNACWICKDTITDDKVRDHCRYHR